MWHFIKYQVRHTSQLYIYLIDALSNSVFFVLFHRSFILSSDEVITPPPPPPPPPRPPSPPPTPPERKMVPPQPVAATPATRSNPLLNDNLYKTLRSSFKSFPSPKKMSHAQSTPDLSSMASENKNNDDNTSSLQENLSNTYSSMNLTQQRPPGSILKRRPQPSSESSQIHEEPIYVSTVSVPLQQTSVRSIQSMNRDHNATTPER